MLSSIFYISILINVRKLTNLTSRVTITQAEKSIIYQTLILLIVKSISIPTLLISSELFVEIDFDLNLILNKIYYPLFFIDVLTTPIVFQITYLFCNKTNLEALLKMNFRKLKTWLIICCGASSNSIDYRLELPNLSSDLSV
ncbi:unnamed protein product [Caenorhabditis angaria]|uniref:Serpentine receptor class gamma n=1 Tax=Caenorhabditis angaria TaxID=860376 RepID=A0A9P1N401_9PELO|nr:unnamed protein product [Caenorhabditis angaria]